MKPKGRRRVTVSDSVNEIMRAVNLCIDCRYYPEARNRWDHLYGAKYLPQIVRAVIKNARFAAILSRIREVIADMCIKDAPGGLLGNSQALGWNRCLNELLKRLEEL